MTSGKAQFHVVLTMQPVVLRCVSHDENNCRSTVVRNRSNGPGSGYAQNCTGTALERSESGH
jgi:hypothetical protein